MNIVSQPVLINNTITHNRAQDGTGLFVMNYVPLFMNNILWNDYLVPGGKEIYLGNETNPVTGEFWNNLYGDLNCFYSNIQDTVWQGTGNISADPRFCGWPGPLPGPLNTQEELQEALASFSLALSEDSPCIGSGEGGADMGAPTGRCPAAR